MSPSALRSAEVCSGLLAALQAAEGRRKRRKRDQTPGAIGLNLKRQILERAVEENPSAEKFEEWLLQYCHSYNAEALPGALSAIARSVYEEWRLAQSTTAFKEWLECGAPSEDANPAPADR